ncbi:MAG: hypothetical protein K2G78_08515, partial [Muribaculaceae bacterium]|nr:hypothetical protein [Muribaculaceae bacterium]
PDSYQVVVNTSRPAVRTILDKARTSIGDEVKSVLSEISTLNEQITAAKAPDASEDMKSKVEGLETQVADLRRRQSEIIGGYAKSQPEVRQIIDLSLLQAGLLKGRELSEFITRSYSML